MNIGSLSFLASYMRTGMPLTLKRVTLDGSAIAHPQNVIVPVGTPIKDVVAFCGGYKAEPKKLIMGGPMMGVAITSDELPILKQNNAILAFDQREAQLRQPTACIRCGRCVAACPMHLMPTKLEQAVERQDVEALQSPGHHDLHGVRLLLLLLPRGAAAGAGPSAWAKTTCGKREGKSDMEKLIVSSSPHFNGGRTTQNIMLDVIIALVPAMVASVILFGFRAAVVILTCVATCVLSEYLCRRVMKRPQTVGDLSCVVTGILLALNLPRHHQPPHRRIWRRGWPLWWSSRCSAALAQNFVNPALTAPHHPAELLPLPDDPLGAAL